MSYMTSMTSYFPYTQCRYKLHIAHYKYYEVLHMISFKVNTGSVIYKTINDFENLSLQA